MELTDTDVQKFQALYQARFSAQIDKESARRKLYSLVCQVELVYKPFLAENLSEHRNYKNDNGDENERELDRH